MDHINPPKPPQKFPISKPDPKFPNTTLCEIPHWIHGPKQGNYRSNSKTNSQTPPEETNLSANNQPTSPYLPPVSPISKSKTNLPNLTLREISHGSHGLKQGNPCPNPKTNSHPHPDKTTILVKDHPIPPKNLLTPPIYKPDPIPPNATLCEIPHGSHGPKKGNPCPNFKTKFRPLTLSIPPTGQTLANKNNGKIISSTPVDTSSTTNQTLNPSPLGPKIPTVS